MSRLNRLFPAVLLLPLVVTAQTPDQLASILQRVDQLEQENRALTDQIRALREELAGLRSSAETAQNATDGRIEIQQRRIDEQAQSKVEASQKFPIRLTGMAL